MTTSTRNPFTTIRTEGALLPVDLLQRIVAGDSTLGGLCPESYHLPGTEKLNEAINRSWNRLLGAWAAFQTSRGRLGEGDPQTGGSAGTTLTRERWLLPLFQELGYGRLQAAKAVVLEGKEYRVSHAWSEVPIHLVGCGVNLDRRQAGVTGAAKSSPHSLVQEYLNRNPNQLWGMLSNGLTLRVLRDNASLTRQAYLEFDLEAMLTGEVYADFVVLWLVCHQSRVETQEGKPETCWLETWSKAAQEQGTRALDKLRDGVEQAITALGAGFLAHPGNTALKARLRSGDLTREGYYRQLLRLVYRLIFLFAAEDRDLLLDPQASPAVRERYLKYYSATHLRQLAEHSRDGRHPDLYATLRLVSTILGGRESCGVGSKGLGLPVLGSFLFSAEALPDLETAELENSALLSAVRSLAFVLDGNTRRSVDYRNLGTRELGSVYESLLELHPQINMDAGTFQLSSVAGNERKTTGSYYTPEDLIKVLLDSALDPVILQAIQRAGPSVEAQIAALLALKVCDPACGSGHFLIAAARRIARRLAQLRSGDEEPSPEITRTALREVIQHCVYGVDINPMSVELCKVNLWLESIEPGKPLSFLDAHIQCGDSLVGVAPGLDISEIPDDAFKPAFGDDKATASAIRKRNKAERAGQMGLDIYVIEDEEDLQAWMARRAQTLDELPEETAEQVEQKSKSYQEYLNSSQYRRKKVEYDLWTAAFFWKMKSQSKGAGILAPTQEMLRRYRSGGSLPSELIRRVEELTGRLNFLHWELRFPKVFAGDHPGFDCVLGNPPWERIKLQEEEFFAQRDILIASAPNKSSRQKLINALVNSNPGLALLFQETKHIAEATSKFARESGRFLLTAVGDVNTYALFTELVRNLVSSIGRTGIIVPSGIATDDTTKLFFTDLLKTHSLISLYDFENRESLFPSVDSRMKFCLLTLGFSDTRNTQSPYQLDLVFFATKADHLKENRRHYSLQFQEIKILNPNTLTCPVFRTQVDANISLSIYKRIPIFDLDNGTTRFCDWDCEIERGFRQGEDEESLKRLGFNDDKLLFTQNEICDQKLFVPLYEGKSFDMYDHRRASIVLSESALFRPRQPSDTTLEQHQKKDFYAQPYYWVEKRVANKKIPWKWFLAFKKVTSATNERTMISTVLPECAVNDTVHFFAPGKLTPIPQLPLLLANLNCIILDYLCRQKVGGNAISMFILKQLPILPPKFYSNKDLDFIKPRVMELVYTSYDMRPFAEDLSVYGEPFIWDEDRRALLRAELDAYYARLYGLTRDELRYILDPQDVYGSDFPGETFRVLKEKEIKQYGEYRTRRLVLEAWDRLEGIERVEEIVQPSKPAIKSPIETRTRSTLPEVSWIPVTQKVRDVGKKQLTPTYRQVVGVAWLLENFGTGQSILKFDANKYAYFVQQKNLADLDIPYKEAARGPYSSQLTYQAGAYAIKKRYWEVKGDKVVKGRNMKEAVNAAPSVFSDLEQAQQLVERLAQMTKNDLGGLATVDFAGRAIFEREQAITPDNIRAYFQSDWPEKLEDPWYTDENILRAMEMLSDLGLFEKSKSAPLQSPEIEDSVQDVISQPMLTDFGLYKCGVCGKMVMGFEKENHEQEKHGRKSVAWKKMR